MLLTQLRSRGLHVALAAPDSYRPPWTAGQRDFWAVVNQPASCHWISRAERYLNVEWPSLEPLYSDYERTGNRGRFEAIYHKRRQVLATFVLAEAFEFNGRFIQPLLDTISRICEEPSWVLPAHEPHAIDLFSAETGNLLAWTHYLFAGVHAFSRSAVATDATREVQARIVEPYLRHDDCWWMALNGEEPGNWTTWCTSNCLGIVLLLETDVERRARAIEKACRSLDRFVDAYKEDGGCDEGPMYWNFAAGCLFDSLEMLFEASGGGFDLFADPVIKAIGVYITKVHVHDLHFVNFADSPPRIPVDAALMSRYGARTGDVHLQSLGAHLYRLLDRFDPEETLRLKMYRTLATLAGSATLRQPLEPVPTLRDSYLPKLQVVVAREDTRDGQGLVLAAKGGQNNERHNHNDVGNVVLYLDGRPVLIDVGMKQYARDTFTDRRYDIWAMQSAYHNVPLVNGCMQPQGGQFHAGDAQFHGDTDGVQFSIDIARAYPSGAGLVQWRRTCVLARTVGTVSILDEFEFRDVENCYEQRFMAACVPRVVNRDVVFQVDVDRTIVMTVAPEPSRVTVHAFVLKDVQLQHAWGDTLYQVRLHFNGVSARGRCEMILTPGHRPFSGIADSEVAVEIEELP